SNLQVKNQTRVGEVRLLLQGSTLPLPEVCSSVALPWTQLVRRQLGVDELNLRHKALQGLRQRQTHHNPELLRNKVGRQLSALLVIDVIDGFFLFQAIAGPSSEANPP
ncbi:Uncharacterized protein APZ42_007428, partial [Daphnia magna]